MRNRCIDGPSGAELEHQSYEPATPPDGGIVLTTTRYRLEGSTLVELDSVEEPFTGVDALLRAPRSRREWHHRLLTGVG